MFLTFIHVVACISVSFIDESYTSIWVYYSLVKNLCKTDEYKTAEPVTVKFFLKDFGITGLLDNEKIIGGNASEGFVICGQYHNSFFAIQRILSFGSKCIIFEPEEFKERVIEIIKKMRDVYNV